MAQQNDKQKQLITEVMNADAKDGLYKQQTAVEWLIKELANSGLLITKDIDNLVAYRKAKQMEKHQRENDWVNGGKAGYNAATGKDFKTFEEYYKETYGTE